jgi:hypothetical protein
VETSGDINQDITPAGKHTNVETHQSWFKANKTLLMTAIIGPCTVIGLNTIAGAWLKDRELERSAKNATEIELMKIHENTKAAKEETLRKQAYEDAIREQDSKRLDQQQAVAQRQRLLTFYAAVLRILERADSAWSARPTQKSDAALVEYDRVKLMPIYADAQKLISDNMGLIAGNSIMRESMSEFARRVEVYHSERYGMTSPHASLRYNLQGAVQALSPQP